MKIRKGFVTNSSSSSFVIAIRNDATIDDIRHELYELVNADEIEKWVQQDWIEAENVKEIVEDVVEELYDYHINRMDGMQIGGWNIGTGYYGNEDSDVGSFFYDLLDRRNQETEHMKISGEY